MFTLPLRHVAGNPVCVSLKPLQQFLLLELVVLPDVKVQLVLCLLARKNLDICGIRARWREQRDLQ